MDYEDSSKKCSYLNNDSNKPQNHNLHLNYLCGTVFGDAGFGKYAFAVALAGLLIVFSDLGLSTLALREIT